MTTKKKTKGPATLKDRIAALSAAQRSDVRKRLRDFLPTAMQSWDGKPESMRAIVEGCTEAAMAYYTILGGLGLLDYGAEDWTAKR